MLDRGVGRCALGCCGENSRGSAAAAMPARCRAGPNPALYDEAGLWIQAEKRTPPESDDFSLACVSSPRNGERAHRCAGENPDQEAGPRCPGATQFSSLSFVTRAMSSMAARGGRIFVAACPVSTSRAGRAPLRSRNPQPRRHLAERVRHPCTILIYTPALYFLDALSWLRMAALWRGKTPAQSRARRPGRSEDSGQSAGTLDMGSLLVGPGCRCIFHARVGSEHET